MNEIYEKLKSTGLPIAYLEFKEKVLPPYIIYMDSGEEQRGSDYKNHVKEKSFTVELYAKIRDLEVERLVDEALSFIEFTKETVYIQSENIYQTIYEFEIISKI